MPRGQPQAIVAESPRSLSQRVDGGGGGFGGKSVESWILYGDKTKSLNGILWFKKQIDNLWSLSTGRFESLIESRSGHDGISFSFIGNKNKRTQQILNKHR